MSIDVPYWYVWTDGRSFVRAFVHVSVCVCRYSSRMKRLVLIVQLIGVIDFPLQHPTLRYELGRFGNNSEFNADAGLAGG